MAFVDRAVRAGWYLMRRRDDVAARRCWRSWIHSLRRPDPLKYALPWIPFAAIEWLKEHVHEQMDVFEWGAGGSTVFFAERVRSVEAVEHDAQWVERVKQVLSEHDFANVRCRHVPTPPWQGTVEEARERDWASWFYDTLVDAGDYASAIDEYPDNRFDLIMIDGPGRIACARHALAKVRPGGYILLDNSDRQKYDPIRERFADYPCQVFSGAMPYRNRRSQSTVWQVPVEAAAPAKE